MSFKAFRNTLLPLSQMSEPVSMTQLWDHKSRLHLTQVKQLQNESLSVKLLVFMIATLALLAQVLLPTKQTM